MLVIKQAVGKNAPNHKDDVLSIQKRLNEIDKGCVVSNGVFSSTTLEAIMEIQKHFMLRPDGVISPAGKTLAFMDKWKKKPVDAGVDLRGNLQKAWDLVSPLLPTGSVCKSGYRSAEDQRRILRNFYTMTYRSAIIQKYGQEAYDEVGKDLLKNETQVLEMVRGVGQAISTPGKSPHQKGKAIDVGGPSTIDKEQVRIIKLVAAANPTLLTGTVLLERNGCVHFEIR